MGSRCICFPFTAFLHANTRLSKQVSYQEIKIHSLILSVAKFHNLESYEEQVQELNYSSDQSTARVNISIAVSRRIPCKVAKTACENHSKTTQYGIRCAQAISYPPLPHKHVPAYAIVLRTLLQ